MKQAQLTNIELCKLRSFEHHPYKVQDDAEMEALTDSIRENGIMTPLLVRPINGGRGEYRSSRGIEEHTRQRKRDWTRFPLLLWS